MNSKQTLKAFLLLAMGLFLYSRFLGGTLQFYINERFVWLTILAAIGFIIVGLSYRYRPQCEHHGHTHGDLSWTGMLFVLAPIILGLLVPARPLGANAMSNRDVSIDSLTSVSAPNIETVLQKPKGERNILDWLTDFWAAQDPSAFTGQEAEVVGFVYRDDRFAEDSFMVSRFIVSCCAADAAPLGLVVRSEDASAFPDDQWVRVKGIFEVGQLDGREMPILAANILAPTDIPNQPYLYPY